jgi:hypothetical protein
LLEKVFRPSVSPNPKSRWIVDSEKLRTARLIKRLPHLFGRNKKPPARLAGATIVAIGTFQDSSLVQGGGLVIDYRPMKEKQTRRAILEFDGTEMWVHSDGAF